MNRGSFFPSETRRNLFRRTRRAILILAARHWKGTRASLRSAIRRFLKPYRRRLGLLRRVVGDARFAAAVAAAFLAAGSVTQSVAGAPIPPIELSDVPAGMGERSLIRNASRGVGGVNKYVRQEVNKETKDNIVREQRFTDKLLKWEKRKGGEVRKNPLGGKIDPIIKREGEIF